MTITDATLDGLYRKLTEDMIRVACDAAGITVSSVAFIARGRDADYSWLCFVVDPQADDRAAGNSASSAVDHIALTDPNGFATRNTGSRLRIQIYSIEVADEASILVRGDNGAAMLTSPWTQNLAVARAKFSYRQD